MKPFYKPYIKLRGKFKPLRYILGKYTSGFFIEGKQPIGYKEPYELYIEMVDKKAQARLRAIKASQNRKKKTRK